MPYRVLIIDDSALMRRVLRDILSSDPEIEVVGASPDPIAAFRDIERFAPDVLTLDVEMPKMDGLTFLEQLMRTRPTPVVMVSSLTEAGCETTFRALELGALDFITKPKLDIQRGTIDLSDELIRKVKSAAVAKLGARRPLSMRPVAVAPSPRALSSVSDAVIAIGASTGGTEALAQVLSAVPSDAPGIVIVQHMPEKFTRHFAERLDRLCAVRVKEAVDGDRVIPGHVLLAPGGLQHMEIARSGATFNVRLVDGPPVHHSRPAVDVLFKSVARALGRNAVGVILTGMGQDGADGMLQMRQAGARTIAQDEATSVVYGMPKEARDRGAAEHIRPLRDIASTMVALAAGLSMRNAS